MACAYARYILTLNSTDKRVNGAYHVQFRCAGVKVCGEADESLLNSCQAYNMVVPEIFEETLRKTGARFNDQGIPELVKESTEQ